MTQFRGSTTANAYKYTIAFLLILSLGLLPAKAQISFSDSTTISLLTVDPGTQAYECFGHTGIRLWDQTTGTDIVLHYGVYNYQEPNFIWHFIEGQCNYMMGGCYTSDFMQDYRRRQLNVTEQVLELDLTQTRQLTDALLDNYRPEHRNYRYNFFFDNCATRPFDMINKWSDAQYDTTWIQPITLRDMIHEMTGTGRWLDFGIALAVASRADQQASFREQMFLPKYLCQALDHATNNGRPLVRQKSVIRYASQTLPQTSLLDQLLSPMVVGILLLLLGGALAIRSWRQKKYLMMDRIFDTIWLSVTGLAGCIIWFLNFFSLHPAVDNNLNCLWLLPTNVLFIALIWIKKAQKVRRIYFFIIFAAEIAYIISVCVSDQYCHPAFIPMLGVIALRCLINNPFRREA